MQVKDLIEKLENYPGDLEITEKILKEIIPKNKNRSPGIKYKKSELKRKETIKKLKELIYVNHKLSNEFLIKKLKISRREFYRSSLNVLAKKLREKYKEQSLF